MATRHASADAQLNDALENGAKRRALEQLAETNHCFGVGHLARVDSAEVPVHEVALHLPLELLVAPILQMLENQHPKGNLGRCARATAATALRKATAHRLEDGLHQGVVLENLVDATKPRIHLLFGLEIPETKYLPESALPVATAKHPDF